MHTATSSARSSNKRLIRITNITVICFCVLFVGSLFQTLAQRAHDPESDFKAFYDGATHIRAGLPLYTPNIDFYSNPYQYTYTPPIALLLAPIVNYVLAWWLWGVLSIACWLGALLLILRELSADLQQRVPALWRPVLLAALISFSPVSSHIFWGQAQLPLLLLLTGSWLALRRDRAIVAGGLLGVAIAIKLFPLLLVLPLVAQRRWRCVSSALAVAVGVIALSYSVVGWEQAITFFTIVLPAYNGSVVANSTSHTTIAAMITNATGLPTLAAAASLIIRLGIEAAVVRGAWRTRAADQAFALGMTTLFLVTPVVWEHYFVLAYLPLLVTFARASTRERAWLVLAHLLLAAAMLVYVMPHTLVFIAQLLPISGSLLLLGVQLRQPASDLFPGTLS